MNGSGERTGLVLSVQRLSTEDGPGLRTTVFLKQCPLACRWCHNPESISGTPELQWFAARCIGCRTCEESCPDGCISRGSDGLRIDRARCRGCGTCASACPSNALELLGTTIEAGALVAALCKDRAYFEASGGGVTLSGGEPLAQPAFSAAVLCGLRSEGISTAVDTCGFASAENAHEVLRHADLVLYDLKTIDPEAHRAFTSQRNEVILRNIRTLAESRSRGKGPRLWIRTPLIPGATATEANLRAVGSWIAENLAAVVERWELCAFNNLCRDQYARLGLPWVFAETPLLTRQDLDVLGGWARASGVDPRLVAVSGAARARDTESEEETA